MTTFIILIIVVYVAGIILRAVVGLMDWSVAQSMAKHHDENPSSFAHLQERFVSQTEAERHEAARTIMTAHLWPLIALSVLIRIYHDAKNPPTNGDTP